MCALDPFLFLEAETVLSILLASHPCVPCPEATVLSDQRRETQGSVTAEVLVTTRTDMKDVPAI